ncbi:unnamed protein product, partial [Iphiclides podalirius]
MLSLQPNKRVSSLLYELIDRLASALKVHFCRESAFRAARDVRGWPWAGGWRVEGRGGRGGAGARLGRGAAASTTATRQSASAAGDRYSETVHSPQSRRYQAAAVACSRVKSSRA